MKPIISGLAAALLFIPVRSATAGPEKQCKDGLMAAYARIDADTANVDQQADEIIGPGQTGPLLIVPGDCARLRAKADHEPAPTVPRSEAVKAEKKECLALDRMRLDNFCKCTAYGDTALASNQNIADADAAKVRFNGIKAQIARFGVESFGIKSTEIRSFVESGQQVAGCWGAHAIDLLDKINNQLQQEAFSNGVTVSSTSGSTPTVSAINGGTPSVSAINSGQPASAPPSGVTYAAPPSSSISGTTSAPSSHTTSDYRTSGAGTNATQSVIDFANAYNKSANSINAVRIPPPPPQVHYSPPPVHYSSPPTTYKGSGISGRSH